MGLETPTVGLQVQPLDTARSTYNPQAATSAMIEAFRNGQISTADIIERSTKMPALRQQVADATDPTQIAARKTILEQNAAQEQLKTQADAFALKQAQDLAKIPPTVRAKVDELAKHGALDPNFSPASYDDNQRKIIEARWADLQQWKNEADSASALNKQVEKSPGYDPVTGNPVPVTSSGKIINAQALEALQKYEANYGTPTSFGNWLKDGKPKAHRDLFSAPPGDVVSAPDGSARIIPAEAPTGNAAANLATTLPPGTSTLKVEARDNKIKINPPNAPGYAVGKPSEAHKPPNTQTQNAASYFSARAAEANDVLSKLKADGFDPASAETWAQSTFLRGPLQIAKSQDVKSFELAKQAWLQGLLRMESGAAISQKEQGWYSDSFFPNVGDGQEVIAQKAKLRNAMENTARLVSENADLGDKALTEIEARADEFYKNYTSGNLVGTPANTKKYGGNAQPVTVDGQKWEYKIVNGRVLVKKPTGQSTDSAAPLPVNQK